MARCARMGFLLLLLAVFPLFCVSKVSAAGNQESLSVNSWWSLRVSTRDAYVASGRTLTWTYNFVSNISVQIKDTGTMVLYRVMNGSQSCVATGDWLCGYRDPIWHREDEYTISLVTLRVTAVGQYTRGELIGHPTWWLVNVEQLSEGGKYTFTWWVPDADAKGEKFTDVEFSVSTEIANIKGVQLKVWSLSYGAEILGLVRNQDGVYAKGSGTETDLFDPTYGICTGYRTSSNATGNEPDGIGVWNETHSNQAEFLKTNLSLSPTTGPVFFWNQGPTIPRFPLESVLIGIFLALLTLTRRYRT
jgi:hypothetical protein